MSPAWEPRTTFTGEPGGRVRAARMFTPDQRWSLFWESFASLGICRGDTAALGTAPTSFCTCFFQCFPEKCWTREEKVRRSFLCTKSAESLKGGVELQRTEQRQGLVWTLVFVMWCKIGFSVVVLPAAVYCFQCHSRRFHCKLHYFASLMSVVYVNSTLFCLLCFVFCRVTWTY